MIKETAIIKKDTSENWEKAKNFIPKKGDIIIYADVNRTKIGDGITKVNDLPFIDFNSYSIEDDTLVIDTMVF